MHRWIGICMCLLFVFWFASGIVMMYVEYPELTEEERLENLLPIDFDGVRISPHQAWELADRSGKFAAMNLATILGRPAYQIETDSEIPTTVFADDGSILKGLSESQALIAAEQSGFYQPGLELEHDGIRDYDQWTLSSGLNASRPLHRVKLNNPSGTVLYVSDKSGLIVRDTNRAEMLWNWIGSTIHWIYPTQLRKNVNLWIDVIVYLSLIGIFSVLTGAIIGFLRLRIRKPYKGKYFSPYVGMMKWHHVLGLLSLIFVSTFIFSGLMSMGPWGIFESSVPQSRQVARYHNLDAISVNILPDARELSGDVGIKEVRWSSIGGEPYLVALRSDIDRSVKFKRVSDQEQEQILLTKLTSAIPSLLPDSELVGLEMLQQYDDYYYSRHNRYRPLPVYRAMFNDQEETWYHIDLTTGEIVNRVTSANRIERWIYNGLHSLDFQILLNRRPLWDTVLIFLSILGLAFSITSVVIGWRRLVN
ncbi:MAG: PepSY domain-containing protein [Gammaproteobacteria bacterium]|nr:PepSY domain-containing protein [Gammaproteobacteria bacterium]MDD9960351.1 PepSY domain-containing protein [Gammaproteobacteria bacterium]